MPAMYRPTGDFSTQPLGKIPQLRPEFAGAVLIYVPAWSLRYDAASGRTTTLAAGTTPTMGHHRDNQTAVFVDSEVSFANTQGLGFEGGLTVLAVGSYQSGTGSEINNLVSRNAGGTAGGFTVDLYNRFGGTPARVYSAYNKPGVGDTNWDRCWIGLENGTAVSDSGNGTYNTSTNTFYAVAATTATGPAASSTTDIDIGRVAGFPSSVNVKLVVLWRRPFDNNLLRRMAQNPYCIFQSSRPLTFSDAGATNNYIITPSGGVVFSGTAVNIRGRVQTPSGGVVLSGTAPNVRGKVQVPSGGVTFGGTAPISTTAAYLITPSGGVTFSGTVVSIRGRAQIPTGGVAFSGASVNVRGRVQVPTGGVTFSGTAPEIRNKVLAPTGGVVFSGTAPIIFNGSGGPSIVSFLPLIGVGK